MKKKISPDVVTGLIAALAILLLVMLPISIRFMPNQIAAQETRPAVEADAIAQTVVEAAPQIVEYSVRTKIGGDPTMAFVGVGGDIEGVVNPELKANVGDTVRITVVNGDPVLHDFKIDEFGVATGELTLPSKVSQWNLSPPKRENLNITVQSPVIARSA